MSLPLLNNPSLLSFVGTVTSITNVLDTNARFAHWGIDQIEQIWQGQRAYQNQLRVITSHPYVGPVAIQLALQDIGVFLGQPYVYPLPEISFNGVVPTEQDTGSFIQFINVEQETEDAKSWLVTIGYAGFDIQHELGTTNVGYGSFSPLDFPDIVRWGTAKYHRSYPTDVNGFPFINTAGDPFDNPPPREESTQCLTIINWSPSYNEPFAQTFRDTINSDTFLGFQPTTVKCKDIDGERIYTSDYGYVWRIKYEFEIRLITIMNQAGQPTIYGWVELILNSGFRAFNGAGGVLIPITIGGVPISSPVILQPDGTYIQPANNQQAFNQQQGVQSLYLVFNNFLQSEFALLGIDQNILIDNQ